MQAAVIAEFADDPERFVVDGWIIANCLRLRILM